MKEFISGKMTKKGQLTVPREIREILNMNEEDRMIFRLNEQDQIREVLVQKKTLARSMVGILADRRENLT